MPPYISIGGYSDPPRMPYLSLEVEKGELVVLKGPPGSGKSNLIKSIAGIRAFSKGSIKVLGSRTDTVRYLSDTVAVFQDSNLVPDLPVRGQLERRIALHRGLATRDVRRDVDRWCVEMELENSVDRLPEKLNRAELQLFSLAPLALAEPAVVLLDEPLMNLSPIGVGHALEMILALLEKAAVLAVCQSRTPLTGKADRVVNLR